MKEVVPINLAGKQTGLVYEPREVYKAQDSQRNKKVRVVYWELHDYIVKSMQINGASRYSCR